MTPTDSAEKVVAELRRRSAIWRKMNASAAPQLEDEAAALIESLRATIERVERERDEALLELGKARLCVNCGQTVRVEDISEVGDCSACQGPDGLSACTFDVVPAKAFEIWRDRYYDQRARVTALEAEKAERSEALNGIYTYCNDTLSGRVDGGPDDRGWQREAVIRARNLARPFARPEIEAAIRAQALSRSSTEVKNDD